MRRSSSAVSASANACSAIATLQGKANRFDAIVELVVCTDGIGEDDDVEPADLVMAELRDFLAGG